jgi:hypothetical protein
MNESAHNQGAAAPKPGGSVVVAIGASRALGRLLVIITIMHPSDQSPRFRDLYGSMRPMVFWLFGILWAGPQVWIICFHGDSLTVFVEVMLVQAAFITVALSRRLHSLVFRQDVPDSHFRRPLLIGAAYYGICVLILYLLWRIGDVSWETSHISHWIGMIR